MGVPKRVTWVQFQQNSTVLPQTSVAKPSYPNLYQTYPPVDLHLGSKSEQGKGRIRLWIVHRIFGRRP